MVKVTQEIIEWSKQPYECECGLLITNGRKKKHINSETCKELIKHNIFGTFKGTDKIRCRKCDKIFTVCGLSSHMKTHRKK